MKSYTYAVSYESDLQPVETIRGTCDAADAEDAVKRACFRAANARVGKWKCRSLVAVVEESAANPLRIANESGPASAAAQTDGAF